MHLSVDKDSNVRVTHKATTSACEAVEDPVEENILGIVIHKSVSVSKRYSEVEHDF